MIAQLSSLRSDSRGSIAIETAIVAPVLIMMSFGAFQASSIVARQTELQSAIEEAATVVLAAAPSTNGDLVTLENVVVASTKLSADNVTLSYEYRCGSNASYQTAATSCADHYSTYVRITLSDTYVPAWTEFGIGSNINYNLTRRVMTKQSRK